MNEVRLNIRTIAPIDLEDAVSALAAEQLDVRFDDQYGNFIDPLTGAFVIAGALAGAKLIVRLWREFKGGTVIDLTRAPVRISREHNLDYGYFVILAKDGSVAIQSKDEPKDALERMVSGALELGSAATLASLQVAIGNVGITSEIVLNPV